MILHRHCMRKETIKNLRDGKGTVYMTHLAPPETLRNNRFIVEMSVEPGASIGTHTHKEETEYYIILSGTGTVDDNGKMEPVAAGDVVITGNGSSHSIINNGTEPLVFNAIIDAH